MHPHRLVRLAKTTPLLVVWGWMSVACDGAEEPEVIPYSTLDRRVDAGGPGEALRPRVCVSGPNVYVTWHEVGASGKNQVRFAAGRAGGAIWDAASQVSSDPEGTSVAMNPEIACVGNAVYLVWEDDRDSDLGHRNVYFRASDDEGRSWQPERLLTSDPEGEWDALEPRIAADPDPNGVDVRLYVAWYDNRFGAYDIYVQSGVNGYNWLAEELRIDTDPPGAAYSAHPILASDGVGGVYVVWEDSRGGTNSVYYSHSIDWGVNWRATDLRLDGGTAAGSSNAFGLSLAVDRSRTNPPVPAVYAAWHDDRNGPKDIFLNRSLDAGFNFDATPTRIDNTGPGASNSFYPHVSAIDDRVLVAWHDDRDVGFDVYLRGSDDAGANWLSETRVDGGVAGSFHSLHPRVARAGERVAVAWADHRKPVGVTVETHPDIYHRLSVDGGYRFTGDDRRVDDDPEGTAISADVQITLAGPLVHFVWVDYRLGNADIWHRSLPSSPQE